MATVSGTFTDVGVSATLVLFRAENVRLAISGTYSQTISLQKATTPAELAWVDIAVFNTDNATVDFVYNGAAGDHLRLYCSVDTSGTSTYSFSDRDVSAGVLVDSLGRNVATYYDSGALVAGKVYRIQPVPVSKTTTTTLTAAELLNGIISANQGGGAAATYTLPTGAQMAAELPEDFPVLGSFEFSVVNVSTVAAEDITIASGSQFTLVGSGAVASNAAATDKSAGTFRVRQSSAGSFVCYRIG